MKCCSVALELDGFLCEGIRSSSGGSERDDDYEHALFVSKDTIGEPDTIGELRNAVYQNEICLSLSAYFRGLCVVDWEIVEC